MKMDDIEELRTQAEEDRRRAYERADADYAAAMTAIKKIKEMLRRRDPVSTLVPKTDEPATQQVITPSDSGDAWPGLRAAIRQIIKAHPAAFSVNSVIEDLRKLYQYNPGKRISVSSELWRMNRDGEISIKERGSGSRPSIYSYKNGAVVNEEEEISMRGS